MNPKSSKERKDIQIGDLWLMVFSGEKNEQQGVRPGLVFQNNTGNRHSPNTIALPLSSSLKKLDQPTHVVLPAGNYGLTVDSVVLCENPQRMSKSRMLRRIGHLDDEAMRRVTVGNLLASGAISYLDEEELLQTWQKSKSLNLPS